MVVFQMPRVVKKLLEEAAAARRVMQIKAAAH